MKRITAEELKRLQLEILENVHNYCQTNRLTYFLACGSLIGAIRHGGYIPWDDDIDIYMPRKDYDIFIRNYSNINYKIRSIEVDKDYNLLFAKVENIQTLLLENYDYWPNIGVNIDIFPIDGVPNNLSDRKSLFRKLVKLKNKRNLKVMRLRNGRKWYKNLFLKLSKLFILRTPRKLAEMYWSLVDKNDQTTEYVSETMSRFGIKACFPRTYIQSTTDIKFENLNVKTMSNYDKYLKIMYGDYMELPPISQRTTHHTINAFWKN